MLRRLKIENYALIEKSEVDFYEGFTVITGETGSGKSIMLDALSLLLGARADSKTMADKNKKTIVEAIFENPSSSLKNICQANNIEWDSGEMILRREISPSGKSRAFVNDTPVNLAILTEISSYLIDIHSQHSNIVLTTPLRQLEIIDTFGNTEELARAYSDVFKRYVSLRQRIRKLKEAENKGKENEEFIRFRLEQLDKIKPKKGEIASLEKEAEILGDADRIKSGLIEANVLIGMGGNSAIRQLQSASGILESIDPILSELSGDDNLSERIDSLKIELRDISDTLDMYAGRINADPDRLNKIQSRLEILYDAMKRFKVTEEDGLVELHLRLKEELSAITGGETDVTAMETELKEMAKELREKADALSERRKESGERFAGALTDKIKPLGMPNIKFKVGIEKGKMTPDGQDNVTFYCSFNKNHDMQPIAGIASGGEISRVMLGIKSLMAEDMAMPTVIFDEIDTGVSGEIAHKMAWMMKKMSSAYQVIAVTHLPQTAAAGDTHLKVYKSDRKDKTVSDIIYLREEDRVKEIAGMLSGNSINDVALANARLLLRQE